MRFSGWIDEFTDEKLEIDGLTVWRPGRHAAIAGRNRLSRSVASPSEKISS
jgi:hypothetical protein